MSSDGEYEYDYSDEEDYVLEEDDDAMEWNPMGKGSSDNPNAPPTISGTYLEYQFLRRMRACNDSPS